jgi:hypothetical protein
MATNARDILFNNGKDESGLYDGWTTEELAKITVPDRAVFYDSNVAFTDGNGSIVDTSTNTHTVPNLYETLKGLNNRINVVANTPCDVSSADAHLFVTNNNGVMIAPGNGGDEIATEEETNVSISIGTSAGDKITISATEITFIVGSQSYSLVDIFKMIHELDCRTAALKTNVERSVITHTTLADNAFTLNENKSTGD